MQAASNKGCVGFGIEFVKDVAELYGIRSISEATANTISTHLNFLLKLMLLNARSNRIACGRLMFDIGDLEIAAKDLGLNIASTSWNIRHPNHRNGIINPAEHLSNSFMNNKVFGDISVTPHWLVIEGKQPIIIEEKPVPSLIELELCSSNAVKKEPIEFFEEAWKTKPKLESCLVQTKPYHPITLENQKLFKEVMEMMVSGDYGKIDTAMLILRSDPCIQVLVPRIIHFVANSIKANLAQEDLIFLTYFMLIINSILENPIADIQAELHILLPSIISCLLFRSTNFDKEGSYKMKKSAAMIIAKIFDVYDLPNAQHRCLNILSNAVKDSQTTIPILVSIVYTFKIMGPEICEDYLFQHLPKIKQLIGSYKPKKEIVEKENTRKHDSTRLGDVTFEAIMDYCRSSLMAERTLDYCRKKFGPFGDEVFKKIKSGNLGSSNSSTKTL